MDLRELLRKVEAAPNGTTELDSKFASVFPSAPRNITRSIDAAVRLIESELPGWWWTCGHCTLSDDASLYVAGSKHFPYAAVKIGPDFRSGPEALRLLNGADVLMMASTVTGAAAPCRSQCWPFSWRQRLPWQNFNQQLEPKTQKVLLNPSDRDVGRRDHAVEASGLVKVTAALVTSLSLLACLWRHESNSPRVFSSPPLLAASGLLWAVMFFGPLAHLTRDAGGLTPFDIQPKGYGYAEAQMFLEAIGEQLSGVALEQSLH